MRTNQFLVLPRKLLKGALEVPELLDRTIRLIQIILVGTESELTCFRSFCDTFSCSDLVLVGSSLAAVVGLIGQLLKYNANAAIMGYTVTNTNAGGDSVVIRLRVGFKFIQILSSLK